MILQVDLLNLPFEKFKFLIENYYSWIKHIDEAAISYIEVHKLDREKCKDIIKTLNKRSLIDINKMQEVSEAKLSLGKALKECLKELNEELNDEDKESEWIVYYNQRDIGRRVKAKTYTEAFLAAYEKYGADGKITKVEKA